MSITCSRCWRHAELLHTGTHLTLTCAQEKQNIFQKHTPHTDLSISCFLSYPTVIILILNCVQRLAGVQLNIESFLQGSLGGGGTANTDGINIITYPCITRRVAVPHLGELGEEVLVFVEG